MPSVEATTDTLDQKRLLKVLSDYRRGDFTARMPADRTGLSGKICDALNDAIERNDKLVRELERLSTVVGKAGNIKQRASLPNAEGSWLTAVDAHAEAMAYQIAEAYGRRGDADRAFEWLERAYVQRDGGLSWMKASRHLRPLHRDARWRPFLEKMGLDE